MNPQKKIWELQHTTICKVVGMALDFEHLKKIGRKFGLVVKDAGVDQEFAFHSAVVGMCGKESRIARHVQKLIERRFISYAKRLAQQDNGAIMEFASTRSEKTGVPLWAVLWHVATTRDPDGESVETTLFGRIHMMEHELVKDFWNGSGEDRDKRESDRQAELEGLRKEIINLRSENARLERANQSLAKRAPHYGVHLPSSVFVRSTVLDKGTSLQDGKIARLKSLLEESRKKNEKLEEDCHYFKNQIQDLILESASDRDLNCTSCEESRGPCCSCPSDHCLRGKRIAMVGGIDGLEAHYRNLVEQSGGEFCRHDGRCVQGERKLEELIKRADLVVCPVSVNSHFGAIGVKKLCKKHGINCCFPDSAGVGTLRNILQEHFAQEQDSLPT